MSTIQGSLHCRWQAVMEIDPPAELFFHRRSGCKWRNPAPLTEQLLHHFPNLFPLSGDFQHLSAIFQTGKCNLVLLQSENCQSMAAAQCSSPKGSRPQSLCISRVILFLARAAHCALSLEKPTPPFFSLQWWVSPQRLGETRLRLSQVIFLIAR